MYKYFVLLSLIVCVPFASAETSNDERSWLELVSATMKVVSEVIIETKVPLAVYGNYCGPQHGDPTYQVQPIDAVDRACMRHDQCYDNGYSNCACDYQMVVDLQRVLWQAKDSSYVAMATGGILWFSSSECACKDGFGNSRLLESPTLADKRHCKH